MNTEINEVGPVKDGGLEWFLREMEVMEANKEPLHISIILGSDQSKTNQRTLYSIAERLPDGESNKCKMWDIVKEFVKKDIEKIQAQ